MSSIQTQGSRRPELGRRAGVGRSGSQDWRKQTRREPNREFSSSWQSAYEDSSVSLFIRLIRMGLGRHGECSAVGIASCQNARNLSNRGGGTIGVGG